MEAQQGDKNATELCVEVDSYVIKHTHLPRIRLFCQLLGLGGGDVEKKTMLLDFYTILESDSTLEISTLHLLQYILFFVGVQSAKLTELDEGTLEECKKVLAYPSAIVGTCMNIRDEDFLKLQVLASEHLKCSHENIKSMEDLCLRLHHTMLISSDDVGLLVEWLELDPVGRADLANLLRHYVCTGVYETTANPRDRRLPQKPQQASDGAQPTSSDMVTSAGLIGKNGARPDVGANSMVTSDVLIGQGAASNLSVGRDAPRKSDGPEGSIQEDENPPMSFSKVKEEELFSVSELTSPPPSQQVQDQRRPYNEQFSQESEEAETTSLIGEEVKQDFESACPKTCLQVKQKRCLVILAVLALFFGLSTSASSIYFGIYGAPYLSSNRTVYGTGGTTVVVTRFSDPLSMSEASIHECLTLDDYPHTNTLYIVDKLQTEQRFNHNSSSVQNQTMPDCTLNLVSDHLYLLQRSQVNLSICLTTDMDPVVPGTLLIFDNNAAYSNYISDDNCHSTQGAHTHNLNIGSNGRYRCTDVTYTSEVDGYHYVVTDLPGNVWLYYKYDILQYYLNPDVFSRSPYCTFSQDSDNHCSLHDLPKTPVFLVVTVGENVVDNSISTHLCFSSHWSLGLILVVVITSVFAVLCVCLSLLSCVCCLYRCHHAHSH